MSCSSLLRYLYSLLFSLALPLVLGRLFYRSLRNPAHRQRWTERLGFCPALRGNAPVWIHTVSLGESIAAAPLVKSLLKRCPDRPVLLTTTTLTGSGQTCAMHREAIAAGRVFHCYAPYDLPGAVGRFLDATRPALAIMMETELWPNTLAACHARQIPVLLTNARLSARSARGYHRLGSLTRTMIGQLTAIAAQTQDDADRFAALGAPRERIRVTGTLKYDLKLPEGLAREGAALRAQWLAERPNDSVVIASSLHPGEEEQLSRAWYQVKEQRPDVLLVVVPRHPEAFDAMYDKLGARGWKLARRSLQEPVTPDTDILLADTLGELLLLYATADVVFIGGSLVPRGGHNPLEAAAQGKPLLTGPHVFNFLAVNQALDAAGAQVTVTSCTTLAEQLLRLLGDAAAREQAGQAALQVSRDNRGALARQLTLALQLLGVPADPDQNRLADSAP